MNIETSQFIPGEFPEELTIAEKALEHIIKVTKLNARNQGVPVLYLIAPKAVHILYHCISEYENMKRAERRAEAPIPYSADNEI